MNATANIKTIAKRELGSYFRSPLAFVFIVIFLFVAGFFTFMLGGFFRDGQASLNSFFIWHPWFYMVLVPAVGMGLWAEERRSGTIELLLTMPITPWQAILGKFLASWLFLGIALFLTFPVVWTVNYLGSPDNGVILASYIASWLLAGCFLAVTCIISAMTRSQVITFVVSVVICFFLILVGFPPVTDFLYQTLGLKQGLVEIIASFSVLTHFDNLKNGVLDSRDIIYFFSVMVFSLFTTGVIIRGHRAG
jgi:ABC-2 type transport system permease protein